jgi:vanillate O-demethylase ferredoxin subunit
VLARDIRELRLVAVDGHALPAYDPGAHIDLHLAPGIVRQYSLCGPPADAAGYTIAVKCETTSRGGSRKVHTLEVGDELDISSPRNHFLMAAPTRHTVLVGAGIGITPLLAMAHRLIAEEHSFTLLYFGRSAEDAAYLDLLQAPPFAEHCSVFLGFAREAVRETLQQRLGTPDTQTHVYLCGPRPFMDLVHEATATWPAGHVHHEYFGADPTAATAPSSAFRVRLARQDLQFDIPPDRAIADVLLEHGVDVPTSCEQGVCGTCITTVLEGTPDHRDSFLSQKEHARADCMAICVSRARSPVLVLDL